MVLQYHSLCFLSEMELINQLASSQSMPEPSQTPHPCTQQLCPQLQLHLFLTCSSKMICQLFFLKLWPKSAETSLSCENKAEAVTTANPSAPCKATFSNRATSHVCHFKSSSNIPGEHNWNAFTIHKDTIQTFPKPVFCWNSSNEVFQFRVHPQDGITALVTWTLIQPMSCRCHSLTAGPSCSLVAQILRSPGMQGALLCIAIFLLSSLPQAPPQARQKITVVAHFPVPALLENPRLLHNYKIAADAK